MSELSWVVTTYLGSRMREVTSWSAPLFEAYCAGAWLLYWTDDTLYWAAKPRVHVERLPGGARRLHRADGPALESDVEPLYFWHGILVPCHAIEAPETLTLAEIDEETNAETRRVLRTLYGYDRWLRDSGAQIIHDVGEDYPVVGVRGAQLYRLIRQGEEIIAVSMRDCAQQPDGSFRRYVKRIMRPYYNGDAWKNCHAAIASTWREPDNFSTLAYKDWRDYAPAVET